MRTKDMTLMSSDVEQNEQAKETRSSTLRVIVLMCVDRASLTLLYNVSIKSASVLIRIDIISTSPPTPTRITTERRLYVGSVNDIRLVVKISFRGGEAIRQRR